MKFETEAKLLSATATPYEVNGNKGTSYKLRFSVDDEIFSCKSTSEQVSSLTPLVGKKGSAVFEFTSPKEVLKMTCTTFGLK